MHLLALVLRLVSTDSKNQNNAARSELIFHADCFVYVWITDGAFNEAKSSRELREMGNDSNEGCVEIRSVKERKRQTSIDRAWIMKQRRQNVNKEKNAHEDWEKDWYKTEKQIWAKQRGSCYHSVVDTTQYLPVIREVWGYLFLCGETTGRTYMAVHFQMSGLISLCANQHWAFLLFLLSLFLPFPLLPPTSLSTLRKHQWPVCNNQSFFTSISNILHWKEFSMNYTAGSYLLL